MYLKPSSLILFFSLFIFNSFAQITIKGNLTQWQSLTLVINGPEASEKGSINPFLDYRLEATFTNGIHSFHVPGYFAADGNATETSAKEGNIWHIKFTPSIAGEWHFKVSFKHGHEIAINHDAYAGNHIEGIDAYTGSFIIKKFDKDAEGFHSKGRLTYNKKRYLYTENGNPLLKFGPNSPENFLAFKDIDGTYSYDSNKVFLKTWEAHIHDWKKGDPTWQNGKGKGIIGALNYLQSKGMNCVYALTMNIGGDARDVWPFLSHERKDFLRYDVSKLAQWDVIFSHAEKLGIIMHLITQETENELLLDDGYTLKERKLY